MTWQEIVHILTPKPDRKIREFLAIGGLLASLVDFQRLLTEAREDDEIPPESEQVVDDLLEAIERALK